VKINNLKRVPAYLNRSPKRIRNMEKMKKDRFRESQRAPKKLRKIKRRRKVSVALHRKEKVNLSMQIIKLKLVSKKGKKKNLILIKLL
jgi:hypothetical protein